MEKAPQENLFLHICLTLGKKKKMFSLRALDVLKDLERKG